MTTQDDETPTERPLFTVDHIEHLCYLQKDTDAVRVWRDGLAENCEICKHREHKL